MADMASPPEPDSGDVRPDVPPGLPQDVSGSEPPGSSAGSPLASEEKYRALFDAIDQGFCIIEVLFDAEDRPTDYRFVEVNAAFEAQTDLEDAVGERMRVLRPEHEEHWFEAYGEIARTGRPKRFQAEAAALGRWYDVYAFPVGDPDARRLGVLFSDVTERRRREDELREAKRAAEAANQAKSDFMATMSHELRTPLNAIVGYTQLLLDGVPEPVSPAVEARIRRISHGARHLRQLIGEVLTFSRLEAGRESVAEEVVRIGELLEEIRAVIEPLARSAALGLSLDTAEAPEQMRTDAGKLRQILVNLLGNAVKFTEEGTVSLRIAERGEDILFQVSDTGPGIAPEQIDHLFEPFWQGAPGSKGGTGLGLTISRRHAELLGGALTVESVPGEGSVFTLRLPVRR